MKKLFLLCLSVIPLFAFAQVHYLVKGTFENIDSTAKIFISYRDAGNNFVDSSVIKNNAFEFKGAISDTTIATLIVTYKGRSLDETRKRNDLDQLQVYLANDTTVLTGDKSLDKAKVSGSRINEDFNKYILLMQPISKEFRVASTPEKYEAAKAHRKKFCKQFLTENPDSYVSLNNALRYIAAGYIDVDEVYPLFNLLSANIRSTKYAVAFQKYMDAVKRVSVGAIAPEFAQADTNGTEVKLSSFKGKYVLVDFWASWCAPCRAENPHVVKAFNKYKGKNFTILSISLDRPGAKASWLNAIHKDSLTWNQVSDLQFWKNEVAVLYGVQAIPQNFLLDPDGKIIAKNLFGKDLDTELEQVLAE